MNDTDAPTPAPQQEQPEQIEASETNLAAAEVAETVSARPSRRAPARGRRRGAGEQPAAETAVAEVATAEPPMQEVPAEAAGEPEQRRAPARRRSGRTTPTPEPAAQMPEAAEAAPPIFDLAPETIEPAPMPEFAAPEEEFDLTARLLPIWRRAPEDGLGESQEAPRARRAAPRAPRTTPPESRTQAYDYEPLPPPTKRKAPRNGVRSTHPAAMENAVDWALGRTSVVAEETAQAEPAVPGARRRRSRRGRRGGGGGGAAQSLAAEENLAQGRIAPAAEGERSAAPLRAPQPPAQQPAREDRGRSQLNTLESLVARQNVVMDQLLAKVASFASIERALLAIERRLASQVGGAAGTAAPRVGIFVDVPNIVYAAERIGVAIDFGKMLHYLTRGRELVRASAYAPISDDPQARLDTQKFVQPFVHRGYRIVTKPLKRFSDGTMKGNFDVELAMDILTMSERLDIISLVSGDGDFSRLVEIVGSKGLRVEVVAFGASTSADLRAICDDYIDLQDHLDELT